MPCAHWILIGGVIAAPISGEVNFVGCSQSRDELYCQTTASIDDRVQDLLSRLTTEEKIGLISPDSSLGGTCDGYMRGVPRLQVPSYRWLTETNTNAASHCPQKGNCATTFVGPMGLGASFNRTAWRLKGRVISREIRAFRNIGGRRSTGPHAYIGVTGYGPNINIARDPRFGRTSELPSEDPYLTGEYGANMVGGSVEEVGGISRMMTYLKHFDAYSTETNRGHDSYNITPYDFWDTYLPQFQKAMTHGGAHGVMCSYNAESGQPSCANGWLLQKLREWNPLAHVATDCGAVENLRGSPVNAPDDAHAAAYAINNGTDVELGGSTFLNAMGSAVSSGLVQPSTLDAAVWRSLYQFFKGGIFDPTPFADLGLATINSTEHQAINFDAAQQSAIMLKNEKSTLPLQTGKTLALVGPMSSCQSCLRSDYAADELCFGGGYNCFATFETSLRSHFGANLVAVSPGVDINSNDSSRVKAAVKAAQSADQVVLAVGIDSTIEYEGVDRTTISLPGLQPDLVREILALNKPTVMLLVNGGVLGIEEFVDEAPAIVEAFNPNLVGAAAISDLLVGAVDRWGRLPVTMYPSTYVNDQPLTNFDMSKPPGRGYRYYQGKAIFPFGHGLTYVDADLSHCSLSTALLLSCQVASAAGMEGDEVLMVYHIPPSGLMVDHPLPIRRLVNFERVRVPAEGIRVVVQLSEFDYHLTNKVGSRTRYSGIHTFTASLGHGDDVNIPFEVPPTAATSAATALFV
eukprot:TRINITY_DN11571_c0_g2_i1.p1 TRINITY_DN11571_c0_g2~~TRINITY_DN11571_c0_g2_i1.p1  ORF type:complete len:777 (+),score=102.26 TRINITY_DN11571_c0_g2_i1:94-2331(+)